ncbi:MAG: hypothetical protein ABL925_02400 [Methylococcales bacterium]
MKYTRNLSGFEQLYFKYQRDFAKRAIEKYGLNGYKDLRRKLRGMLQHDGFYIIPHSYESTSHEVLPYGHLAISWFVSMANFLGAKKDHYANKSDDANKSLMEAVHACGVFQGFAICKENINDDVNFAAKEMVSEMARKSAFIRHSENHAIKKYAMNYYAENIETFPSKDNAAEQIAGKIVPAKFRTVRQWITEYHKNLRSTGTL